MTIETLRTLFFWSLIINCGIYTFAVVASISLRDYLCRTHQKLFALDRQTVLKSLYGYLAAYKLMIIVFNFTPWLALLVIG